MKTEIKKFILSLVLAVAAVVCLPQAFAVEAQAATYSGTCGENLTWSLNTETGELVIDGTGAMTNYYSYSSSAPWYKYRSNVKNVTIGNGVTTIGSSAFEDCTGLTSVTIGNSVTSIGYDAFYNCKGLTSVTIPDSVTTIGDYAFYYCTKLTSVYYTGDVAGWCAIEFNDSASNPMRYADKLYINNVLVSGNLTILDSVTTIGSYAFCNCTGLTSVTIPDSVTTIGSNAFLNCTGLTSVTIGNGVTSISDYAFYNCEGLTSVTIPDSVTEIGNYAFRNCNGLTSVTIPDSVTTIGRSAFEGCTGLTGVTIPDSVTTIGNYVFYGCTGLTSVTIPDSVTSIGDYAFHNCTGLTSVTIPDSVTSIGNYAFYGCTALSAVCFAGTEEEWKAIGYSDWSSPEPTIYFDHAEHKYTQEEIITPPTCTTAGSKTYSCVCGAVDRTEVIPATGHSLERVTVEATCLLDGKTCYQCRNCQAEYGVTVVPAKGHTAGEWETKTEPTCTEDGVSVKKCTVCKTELETQPVSSPGHTAGEWETKTEPTCTEDGVNVKKCTVCKTELETQSVSSPGHTAGEWETKTEPTCTEDGVNVKKCTVCKTELETQPVSSPGHTAGEWETKTEPTCTEDGVNVKKCTVCKTELETQPVYSPGHTAGEWETKTEPTCTKDGINVKRCTVCQAELETQVTSATGHKYEEAIIKAPTCTATGEKKFTCACGDTYTEVLPVVDHDKERFYVEPTVSEPGYLYYICNFCGNMVDDMVFFPAMEFEAVNGMVVDHENGIIYGLSAGIDSLDGYTNVVTDGAEWEYTETENGFGTGAKAVLKNGDTVINEYTVLIFGDVNGDGWYDGNDAFLVNLIVSGMLDKDDIGEAVWTAADCNHDGEINEADYELLRSAGLLLNDVDQSKPVTELITNKAYIEYMSLIDQSVVITTDNETNDTNADETVGQGLAPAETGSDFEIIIADIIAFVKQIFSFIMSLIFN